MNRSRLHFYWKDRRFAERFRTGVSLHSHTLFSRERLDLIPRYAMRIPILREAVTHRLRRYRERTGQEVDFGRAWWTPPLPPRQAHDLERTQIEQRLDLEALVSLTDHDSIEAGLQLSVVDPAAPLSVEWTVPFGASFFHLGLHNLPRDSAAGIMARLSELTAQPKPEAVREMLGELDARHDLLIVFNHPLWDEKGIGLEGHRRLFEEFMGWFGRYFHAFELNGWRTWAENRAVMRAAAVHGKPVISGGDRHGLEPNANVNLTNAGCFEEFVEEIRAGISDVLFLPQYRESRTLRTIHTIGDILRDNARHEFGWVRWTDRIFYRCNDGVARNLTELWRNGKEPAVVLSFVKLMALLDNHQVRSALRVALPDREEVAL
ncbi:MAG TPA: hypothetical protein DEH78_09440 [Solibacterales bacterium]|nr:hypothetical protein [Bryobacterales bacterium]